jgi:nucleotide-binding universal stress UspA family protein
MTTRPHVLCPIDFSEPARAALGYAAAIAEHFGATLDILAVDDPLLADVAASTGRIALEHETTCELRRFCERTLARERRPASTTAFHVRTGRPAAEILRASRDLPADVVVMSSRGRSGVSKLFFGSTTERVLRATPVPVLVTPDAQDRGRALSEIGGTIKRILVPVDLTPASTRQAAIACGIASALSVPLLLAHALEPVFVPAALRAAATGVDAERRAACEEALVGLTAGLTGCVAEHLIVSGDPAEEIVKLASVRGAGLIVIALHSGGPFGPRMGSVTYRVLCQSRSLILALPPAEPTE